MQPTLYEGDVITVEASDSYEVGDILVFTYKFDELLVHRLLQKKDDRYFCKGDNSFRTEDVTFDQIVGKVSYFTRNELIIPIVSPTQRLIELSWLVGRQFFKCRYVIETTKQANIYRLYEKTVLMGEDIVIYKKNDNMEYIRTDDTSLAIFDPDSGDTHFIDETGIDILECLSEPCDLDTLLEKLCEIYETEPDDIRSDVEEFLSETVRTKVVELI